MPQAIVAAASFTERYGNDITAVLTLLVAIALAATLHRTMGARARRLAAAMAGGDLSPVVDTRLRFLRRIAEAAVLIVGIALAVAQFTELDRLASTVLASSAIAAAVVGFAARQVLANAIAGVVLAITQPLRIGDLVTFEEQTGTVEDISLTYTWLRMGTDARLIIPNERLAQGMLRNDSIRSETVALEVSLWLAPDADEGQALRALAALDDAREVRVAEITAAGVRVSVAGPPVPPAERLEREAGLRASALGVLRTAGIPRAGGG